MEVFPRRDGVLQLTVHCAGVEAASMGARALAYAITGGSGGGGGGDGFIVTYAQASMDSLLLETMWRICLPCMAMCAVDAADAIIRTSRAMAKKVEGLRPSPPPPVFKEIAVAVAKGPAFEFFRPQHLARILALERAIRLAAMESEAAAYASTVAAVMPGGGLVT